MIKNFKYLSICFIYFVNSTVFGQLNLVSNQQIDFSNAVSTTKSGNWSDVTVWSSGQVPNATTDVIINDNHTIYIDIQGAATDVIVDLCRNLNVKSRGILQMGHNTPNFAKDLRINGSILCNGTFSSGRNKPGTSGDGSIYSFNSRIFLNLTSDITYISGSGYFHPRVLSIANNNGEKNLIIDLYNMALDEIFVVKSNNKVNVSIEHFAYVKIKGILGLTGSDYQFSSPTAKASLTIKGIVVTNDVSLFTKNTTAGESTSIVIENQGVLYTQSINKNIARLSEAAGFNFTINAGGLFRLGENTTIESVTTNNPNFTFVNYGEVRKHYLATLSNTATINEKIDEFDPKKGASVPQIKDIFGSSHIDGWYNFTDRPYLLEGLDAYKDFGATSIKTTLSSINGNMKSAYHFNHTWPNFQSLKEVAQHSMMDSLFKRTHIKNHTFWATTKNQPAYRDGPDFAHNNYLYFEQQFYDLTKYLLTTYGTMNKTFTYQNWEGDWMLRGQGVMWENNPSLIPDDVDWIIEGMARMFRARQRGTERARNEHANATAKVFHAIEFNKLWMLKNGTRITMMQNNTPSVLGNVIPSTRLDLSSWSAYDGGWFDANNPHGHAMWKGLEIARYYTNETKELNANFPVQIGEFGINENPLYYQSVQNPTDITNRYSRYIGVALGLGIPNFYLWNMYGNDKAGPDGFVWQKDTQYDRTFLNQWLVGKWMRTPEGNWGVAATFLMEQWANSLSNTDFDLNTSNIILFPNPAHGSIKFQGLKNNRSITVIDVKGLTVAKFVKIKENEEINLNHLHKGLYLVIIQNENQSIVTKKLLIN